MEKRKSQVQETRQAGGALRRFQGRGKRERQRGRLAHRKGRSSLDNPGEALQTLASIPEQPFSVNPVELLWPQHRISSLAGRLDSPCSPRKGHPGQKSHDCCPVSTEQRPTQFHKRLQLGPGLPSGLGKEGKELITMARLSVASPMPAI